jgi:hypothetical protein
VVPRAALENRCSDARGGGASSTLHLQALIP